MSDLIKREDAIKAIEELPNAYNGWSDAYDKAYIISTLEEVPKADRPQGEWLKFGLGRGTRILFCTNCERRIEVPLSQGDSNYNFCPNCGADMTEREGE